MRYVVQKLAFYIAALWIALTVNFILPRLMPGNPIDAILMKMATQGEIQPETRAALEAMLGTTTDAPLLEQYVDYLGNLFRGDLGVSVSYYPAPVAGVLSSALPWTILLMGTATVISFIIAQSLGIVTGWRQGRALDAVAVPTGTVLQAIPYFWLALLLSFVFYRQLGWFPRSGGYDYHSATQGWNWDFISSTFYYGTLPAVTVVVSSLGAGLVGMRNMMVSTLGEDYVITAEAKGLRPRRIMLAYAARNAIMPSLSGFAIALGFVVGGSVLTEIVFEYPGVGNVLLTAIHDSDYPMIQGAFLIITVSVLAINFIVDMLYGYIDPRTRARG